MKRVRALCLAAIVCLCTVGSAAADDKADASAEFSRGLAAMSRGELDEAAKHFNAVVKLDPNSFEAHNNLAVILTEQGNYEGALAELQKVVELKPDYYRGRRNLAELYVRLAHDAFLVAASVAPPDEKGGLENRARLVGAPPGSGAPGTAVGGVLEPAAVAPAAPVAAAPAAAPAAEVAKAPPPEKPAAAPPPAAAAPTAQAEGSPAEFITLPDGVPALALSDGGMRLYRQIGGNMQPAERIPVKQGSALPSAAQLYVAVPAEGRVELVPLERTGRSLSIRDASGGKADIVVEPPAFAVLQQALQAYLSPAAVGSGLPGGNAQAAQAKQLAVLESFTHWMKSWQAKDLQGYLGSYAPDYNPRGGPGPAKWREQRQKVFERSGDITITLSSPVILDGGDSVIALVRQEYTSKLQSSVGVKRLTWTPTPQGWKITTEEMLSEKIQKRPG